MSVSRRKYYYLRYVRVPSIKVVRWFKHGWKQSWRFRIASVSILFVVVLLLQLLPQNIILPPAKASAASHQFTPVAGQIVTGTSLNVNGQSGFVDEGINVGSWKGTIADDSYHWQVTSTTSGYDVNLTLGGVALNGANTMFVQTDFDLDTTAPSTMVQICDWVSSSSVDNSADAACTGGGWRTLNNRKQGITSTTPNVGYLWQIYNGYWSDGSNNSVSTPLTNFVNSSNQAKVRYYSTTNTTSTVSLDFLKLQAVVNPLYTAGGFVNEGGGALTNDYTNTTAIHQGASDNQYTQFAGDAGSAPTGYFIFKNIKTYTGMNTALARFESSCASATSLRYKLQIRNFNATSWEDASGYVDCSITDATQVAAKNNVTLSNYIAGGELWLRLVGDANSTNSIRVDQIYMQLGSTNSDTGQCEVTFGSQTAGRVINNPSTGYDEAVAVDDDTNYIYSVGSDSVGGDRQWRIEKRNKSDGALVSAFDSDGIVQTDPSSGDDIATTVRVDSSYIYIGGYDASAGNDQYRIEKRDITTGALVTAFDGDGVFVSNPGAGSDQLADIDIDSSYIYLSGKRSTNVWRYEKIDITTGAYDTGFDGDGALESTNGSNQMTPAALKVDSSYIYTTGTESNNTGAVSAQQIRIEKRSITDGSYDLGFDSDGYVQSNPNASTSDQGNDIAIDGSNMYIAAYQGGPSSNGRWRIEKRSLSTGASVDFAAASFDFTGAGDPMTSIAVDGSYIYGTGVDSTTSVWRAGKFDITTGALVTAFQNNGYVQGRYKGDTLINSVAIDGSNVYYVGGFDRDAADAGWMMEKRDITTGALDTSFGANDCSATRTIDTTSNSPQPWRLLTEDQTSNQGHDYYAYDTDGDGNAEEAAATNINFDATLGSATQMTGLFFAGQFNGGVAATTQLGAYSDIGGGWQAIGSSASNDLSYTDNVTAGASVAAGIQSNADSYVNTTTNRINLRLRTTADGATTFNGVYDIDFMMASMQWVETTITPSKTHVFLPTASNLTTGTTVNITGSGGASGEGTNLGSWRALLAPDSLHWTFNSTASGMNAQIDFSNVSLNGANSIMMQTTFDQDATVPNAVMQICDWVSSSSVDNAADAQCTTGGWRTINNRKAGANNTSPATFTWQIYDGFWNSSSNTAVSTPLTNFVNGSNVVKVRFYSTTNTTTNFALDSVAIIPMINSLYSPAGLTNLGSGSVTNTYSNVNSYLGAVIGSGSSAQFPSDDNRVGVAGTAGSISDSYFTFKNIKTIPGMNTIMVRAEHRCSTTGINYKPKIYNFQSGQWEDLSTANIACSTTDATNVFAKNNVDLSNYLNNGEARIGWYGLANSTLSIETDVMYVMVGMTNSDASECDISFGTLSAGSCSDTRDIDTPGTTSSWNILAEDESTNQGHDYYGYDTDNNSSQLESRAGHVKFNMPYLVNGPLIGFNWGFRYLAGSAGSVQGGIRDYGASSSNLGGFTQVGNAASASYVYTDPFASNSPLPFLTNPEAHRDPLGERMWVRMRTSTANSTANNAIAQWDFAFIAPIWIETSTYKQNPTEQLRHGGYFKDGVEQPIQL